MQRRVFSLTITLLVLMSLFSSLLTGCGQPSQPAGPTAAAEPVQQATEAPVTEEAHTPTEAATEEAATDEAVTEEAAVSGTSAQEPVTIVWFEHLSTEWGDEWFDEVTADFEAKTGIHVERVSAPWNDLWPKMTTWAQSGEMPDVIGTWAGWTATLDKWDALTDLEPLIPQLADVREFEANQGAMWPEIGKFNGRLVMAPWWLQSYGLFYNKEAFEEKGYKVPATWDELRALLEQIKKDGGNGINMAWGVPAEAGIHFAYLQWMWRALGAGGRLADQAGNPAFNTPEGKLAMQYWADLYNDGLILPGSEASSVQQNRGDFCSGKTLMIVDGPWMGATCETMGATFTVEMAPGLCGEKTCGNVVYPWFLTVSEDSKHKVEALKFIEYIVSDEVALDFSKKFSTALANPIRYTDSDFADHPITGKMQDLLAAEGNQPLPATPYAEEVQVMIGTEWQKVLFGKETVDEAIASIEKQWQEIVSK